MLRSNVLRSICYFTSIFLNNRPLKTYNDFPIYEQVDLGATYQATQSTFKLWSPQAEAVILRLYEHDLGTSNIQKKSLQKKDKGIWEITIDEDLKDLFYTFQIQYKGKWLQECADPYSIACGRNGQRSQIIEWKASNPIGWENYQRPHLADPNDIIIYEMHIRDFSIAQNSGIQQKGLFLGLTETNTQTPKGISTGLQHLKEMGITHVHLLPSYDFNSVDESLSPNERGYNWGYDPHLYNVPEGSYSTNPSDGYSRILEFKQAIQSLHQAGIRVIMDVVYNHTGATEKSIFNQLVPNYYYRQKGDGSFSDASACGNETASERPMMRQFMLHSIRHWIENYHIDGFRFDLMGIHDIETMNAISKMVQSIDPSIFLYGEGWAGGDSPLPEHLRAVKQNTSQLQNIAVFSDEIRDGIKGHVFSPTAKGFISGQNDLEETIKFGVVAATQHPQLDYSKVNYTNRPWSPQAAQCIGYASCHDNHTLWDRLALSRPDASESDRIKMHELALAIVLTSQAVPFLHAGSEFCRTKQGVENSYKSPDNINQLDWGRKEQFAATTRYVQALIALRKKHPAFRMRTKEIISENLHFLTVENANLVAFELNGEAVGDEWKRIIVAYNGKETDQILNLPAGNWTLIAKANEVNIKSKLTLNNQAIVPAYAMLMLKY